MPEILTLFHKKVLAEIGKGELSKYVVWSGGTALSHKYLQHRCSYDLDFMSKDLLPDDYILLQIKKIAENLRINNIEEQKRFNRHQFWLTKGKKTLKIEFVFYPFFDIKKPKRDKAFNVRVDSIEDILTNKIHAIFERIEPKDIFDLYCILQKTKTQFPLSLKWVKKKFGVEIDPVLLSSRILEGAVRMKEIKPLILKKNNLDKINEFFEKGAHEYLKRKIK